MPSTSLSQTIAPPPSAPSSASLPSPMKGMGAPTARVSPLLGWLMRATGAVPVVGISPPPPDPPEQSTRGSPSRGAPARIQASMVAMRAGSMVSPIGIGCVTSPSAVRQYGPPSIFAIM